MNTILDIIEETLLKNPEYKAEEGKLIKAKIYSDAMTMDKNLINLLLSVDKLKDEFFIKADGIIVFDKQKFTWLVDSKEFLPDSYTRYSNKVGLSINDNYLAYENDVVLTFPYKDAFLSGGQTKEDQKRDEIFFNETISSEHISKMLESKVLTNSKIIAKEEIKETEKFTKDDNLILKGNNLIALSSLLSNYKNKVKLVYIDPPYNTGGDANIFTYNNTFNHSTWLTFMKNRLEVAKNLLREDGFIAIAIDHSELFYLGALADEIFDRENRVGIVSVVHKPEGRNQEKFFATSNEFMLVYAKDKSIAQFNEVVFDDEKKDEFCYSDKFEKYKLNNYLRSGGGDHNLRKNKPHFYYPIFVNPKTLGVSLVETKGYEAVYPITRSGQERTWKTKKDTLAQKINEDRIVAKKTEYGLQVFEKYYISEHGQLVKTHWIDKKYNAIHYGTNLLEKTIGRRAFSYPKSLYLVKDTIELMTSGNDIVLDFFAGSGTTGHATLVLNKEDGGNRKFILVEQLDEHIEICQERIFKVLKQENINSTVVYTELLTQNDNIIDEIQKSSRKDILKLKNRILNDNLIVPYLTKEEIKDVEEDFKLLTLPDQKQILLNLIDKNKIYINYTDLNNEDYKIKNIDKVFTECFYKEEQK